MWSWNDQIEIQMCGYIVCRAVEIFRTNYETWLVRGSQAERLAYFS